MIAQSPLTSAAPLAAAIFLVTIGLVIVRPWRLIEASAALLGAGAMVLAGLVSPSAAVSDVAGHWNVLLFFLGLTGAASVAQRKPGPGSSPPTIRRSGAGPGRCRKRT